MKKITLLLCGLVLLLASCSGDEQEKEDFINRLDELLKSASPSGGLDFFELPQSNDLAAIPQDPKNSLTSEKVLLGQLLYHETALGTEAELGMAVGTYSCASCHMASAGFQAGRHQGLGDGGEGFGLNGEGRTLITDYTVEMVDAQPLRTPTAMNGAYQKNMLWNGQFGATGANMGTEDKWVEEPLDANHLGYEGLEIQAIAGLKVHRMEISPELMAELGYKEMFDQVFQDFPADKRYSRETAGLAIAAYERTLLSNQSSFQRFLKEDPLAMNVEELKGAIVFFDRNKGNCVSCHTGPALNSESFHALGMKDLHEVPEEVFRTPADHQAHFGRGGFTLDPDDMFKFKTPQLYNLTDSPFYGHGASFRSVREVVEYKNRGQIEKFTVPFVLIAEEFRPLQLTDEEILLLTTFLETALYDPNLSRYEPNGILSGNCFPNNDALSREQTGCK